MGKRTTPEAKAFRALIRGRVQGVGFRWYAIRQARHIGVRGTIANRPDGSVEVTAEGDEGALALFLAWLERGPPGARVYSVDTEWVPPSGAWTDFDVEY